VPFDAKEEEIDDDGDDDDDGGDDGWDKADTIRLAKS